MLEFVEGIEESVFNIADYLISELEESRPPYYAFILMQGVCLCLWYSTPRTLMALREHEFTSTFFERVLSAEFRAERDVEIKRLVIGLSSVVRRNQSELRPPVQHKIPGIMGAIVRLCERSIIVRNANLKEIEQAEEDNSVKTSGEIYEQEENSF